MTAVSELIKDGFREGNIIAVGSSPTTDQQAEGLAKVNSFYQGLFGFGVGEELTDWLAPQPQRTASVAANYPLKPDTLNDKPSGVYLYPPVNSRIVWGGTAMTLWFPEAPKDGSRMAIVQGSGAGDSGVTGAQLVLDGNGRTIEGSNTLTYTNPVTPREWFFRADTGDWKAIAAVALTDENLLPAEFDELVSLYIFLRLAPRYGKQLTQEQALAYKALMDTAKTRYQQIVPTQTRRETWYESAQSFGSRGSSGWMT